MPVHAHGACDVKYDIRMKESCKTDCRFEFLVEFCVYSDIGHVTSVTSVTFVTSVCNVCNVCNVSIASCSQNKMSDLRCCLNC